jgi:hypothetical protein
LKILPVAVGLMACCVLNGCSKATPQAAGNAKTSVVPEKIWEEYSQVFARDLSGRARAAERVAAFSEVMTNHPPIVLVRLSPEQPSAIKAILSPPKHDRIPKLKGIQLPKGSVAMGAFLGEVVRYAYELGPQFPQNRIIVPEEFTTVRYDYINTMPQGSDALRRALKEQLGLVARREMRGNLILTVKIRPAVCTSTPWARARANSGC